MVAWFPGGTALVIPTLIGLMAVTALVRTMINWPEEPLAQSRMLRWTIFSLIAHLLFGLLLRNVSGIISDYLAAPDANAYHFYGNQLAQAWSQGFPAPDLPAGKEGFYYLLAALYWLFGSHDAAGLAVNATLAAALVPIVSDTTRRLVGTGAASYVPPLVVLIPGLFLWTSQLLKEAAIVFLVALAANLAVRSLDRISLGSLMGVAGAVGVLFTFRAWVALVMAAGFVAGIALGRRELLSGLGTAVGVTSLGAVVLALGLGYSGYQAAIDTDLNQAQIVREDLARSGASGFDAGADISTPSAAITYLPKGLASFTLGPFPWQITGARQLAVVPDLAVWWLLLPSMWRGVRGAMARAGRRILVLAAPAIAAMILLSLAVGNFGTVVRERTQVLILLVPFIALGLWLRAQRRSSPQAPSSLLRNPAEMM